MAETYEDLAGDLKRDRSLGPITGLDGETYALRWLDEHPDQVPGRTITESTACDLRKIAQHSDYAGFAGALSMRGITVVPDPKPTNAEKLEALILKEVRGNPQWDVSTIATAIDEAGAKAPGGDDEADNHV